MQSCTCPQELLRILRSSWGHVHSLCALRNFTFKHKRKLRKKPSAKDAKIRTQSPAQANHVTIAVNENEQIFFERKRTIFFENEQKLFEGKRVKKVFCSFSCKKFFARFRAKTFLLVFAHWKILLVLLQFFCSFSFNFFPRFCSKTFLLVIVHWIGWQGRYVILITTIFLGEWRVTGPVTRHTPSKKFAQWV